MAAVVVPATAMLVLSRPAVGVVIGTVAIAAHAVRKAGGPGVVSKTADHGAASRGAHAEGVAVNLAGPSDPDQ